LQPTGAAQQPPQQGGYQAYGQQQPPQGQYGAPQQTPYGAPQQQYGAPQQGGYPPQGGAPAPGGRQPSQDPNKYRQLLQQTIQEKGIQSFFQNPQILDQICHVAPGKVQQLCQTWRVDPEVGHDIVKLALFDIILYIGMSPVSRFTRTNC
jgi:hypothetical protein